METYHLISFALVLFLTVLSPGPAVLFTIHNVFNANSQDVLKGILGVATGILIVGFFATLLIMFTTEAVGGAFKVLNLAGAFYFLYLAANNLKAFKYKNSLSNEQKKHFFHGLVISLLNPKALAFFIFIFPTYMQENYISAGIATLLTSIFALNVLLVHCFYYFSFNYLTKTIGIDKFANYFNRLSAFTFFIFALFMFNQFLTSITQ
ncbi:hypothetical protein B0W48_03390 [Pseudoalteromonas aliena]|uniref:Lysine transporter LysE n=1 Tax=Pseudoalteromonas aliena TaxID=247523 RepID=A0A1Q2GUZ3_9GAMM|nr:LysE family translocator [Pseudoalteromonas aliena]AQP98922.1 hypothetical protein B0W48_03390 [Pseudoalteromonas aliena]